MIKKRINPLYLNKNVVLNLKKSLYNKKYVKIIQLKNFFRKEKIDLVFNDICNSRKLLFYTETYNGVNVPFFEYKWSYINRFLEFIYSPSFMKYLWFFYNVKISFTNTDLEIDYVKFYEKLWNNKKFILQEYNNNTFLWWHNDVWSEKKSSIWRFWLYIWKDYKKEEWWFLELWYKNGETFIVYDKIIPYYNSIFLLIVEENAYHKVWKINSDKFNRKLFTKEIFKV